MAISFSSPVITRDAITGLYRCRFTVAGNTQDATATVAEGVGDTPYQAKRHAVVTYRNGNPLAFLDIPA